jgi:hypothetical protein
VRKVGRRTVQQPRRRDFNPKAVLCDNSGQIYKTHRSVNREWENFILQLYQSRHGSIPEFFLPNDAAVRNEFSRLLSGLENFLATLRRKAQEGLRERGQESPRNDSPADDN